MPNQKTNTLDFPGLISRQVNLTNTPLNLHFIKNFTPTHQKGRGVLTTLQPLVNTEHKQHILQMNSCSDKKCVSTIFIAVKRDKIVKLALDSKIPNNSIHENKCQMSISLILTIL